MDVAQRYNVTVGGVDGGQPMLFAHGFGCDQQMWRFVEPAFADRYRTILFDHVGAGHSDASAWDPETYGSLDAYAADVLAIVHEMDLHDVVFVGHSVSAMIGVLAANAEPDRFASLVLVGPSPRYIDDDGYTGGSPRPTSRSCSVRWTATTWAGPAPWRRWSWATPIARPSVRS